MVTILAYTCPLCYNAIRLQVVSNLRCIAWWCSRIDNVLKIWRVISNTHKAHVPMGFAVRVRPAGQKYGPTCHQRDRADVTEFVTLGQHVGVLALAGYKRRKSAPTAGPIEPGQLCDTHYSRRCPSRFQLHSLKCLERSLEVFFLSPEPRFLTLCLTSTQ